LPTPAAPYRIAPLLKSHDRRAFSSGSEPLDRYLQQQARQDAEKRVAAPFVLVEPPANRVLGYYTLSASVITADELPDKLAKTLPRYPQLPVILLGRLAVDQSCKGRGIGQFLLMDALAEAPACLSVSQAGAWDSDLYGSRDGHRWTRDRRSAPQPGVKKGLLRAGGHDGIVRLEFREFSVRFDDVHFAVCNRSDLGDPDQTRIRSCVRDR